MINDKNNIKWLAFLIHVSIVIGLSILISARWELRYTIVAGALGDEIYFRYYQHHLFDFVLRWFVHEN